MKTKEKKSSMPDIMQIQDFAIGKLNLEWHFRDIPPDEPKLSIDYDLFEDPQNGHRMRMDLTVKCGPKNKKTSGYEIEACVWGAFFFPEGIDNETMYYLIRLNGATVLYGLLRGQLATITGSFPGGKFILPTVHMKTVVAEIENKKIAELTKSKSPKRALKSPTKKSTRKPAITTKATTSKRFSKQSPSKTKISAKKSATPKKKTARKTTKKK